MQDPSKVPFPTLRSGSNDSVARRGCADKIDTRMTCKSMVLSWTMAVLCSLSASFCAAQPVDVYVKKGDARVSGRLVPSGQTAQVGPGGQLEVMEGSAALVRWKTSIAEVRAGQAYTYDRLMALFRGGKSYSKAFLEVITNQQHVASKSSGVTMRGDPTESWAYSPADSFRVLGDSLVLTAGSGGMRLLTEIRLFRRGGTDTIRLPADRLRHALPCPPPGAYVWTYIVEGAGRRGEADNLFIVPDTATKSVLVAAYQLYRYSLSGFTEEMRGLLLDEYARKERIHW